MLSIIKGVARRILPNTQFVNDFIISRHRFQEYAFDGDVRQDIGSRLGFSGDLLDIYANGSAQSVHKWHHYLPLYDRYFSPWRDRPVRFLEIGVQGGGSLSMWRKYFGPDAIIFGVDIDPDCAQYDGIDGRVRIGSQDDPAFLQNVVVEMGGIDVVLDDGSHMMQHIKVSLETLFPLLGADGIYMIEDLHSAYWKAFGGGYARSGNFFQYIREITDDMHRWYHVSKDRHPVVSAQCAGIHVHDSLCVLEKGANQKPTHSRIISANGNREQATQAGRDRREAAVG